jgi:hypothetical protein
MLSTHPTVLYSWVHAHVVPEPYRHATAYSQWQHWGAMGRPAAASPCGPARGHTHLYEVIGTAAFDSSASRRNSARPSLRQCRSERAVLLGMHTPSGHDALSVRIVTPSRPGA